jgi:hypothetical protein
MMKRRHSGLINSINRAQPQTKMKNKIQRKQGEALTSGLFQVPSSVPDQLLNPCRPGAKKGNNFKCTNSVYKSQFYEC